MYNGNMNDTLHFTNISNSRQWGIKIIREGDGYGRDNCLTHDEPTPLVEFYDRTYADKNGFGPDGQFVSRYYLDTLTIRRSGGLNLDCGIEVWSLDAPTMSLVREWLNNLKA